MSFGNMCRGFIKTFYFLLNNAICYPIHLMLCLNRLDQRVVVKRSGLPTLLSTPSHRWPVAFYFLFSLPPLWCWLGLVAGTRIICSEFLLTLPSVLLHLLARIPTLALLAAYWCFFWDKNIIHFFYFCITVIIIFLMYKRWAYVIIPLLFSLR